MAKSKSSVRTEKQLHRSAIRLSHKGDPAWEARWAWERIMDRIVYKRGGRNKCYEHIELKLTRDEFLEWAIPAYAEWMAANPGKTPSVDRIESTKHYEAGNLRVLEHHENARLSSHLKNLKAPAGMAWCSLCQDYLPKERFYVSPRYQHGVTSECKECAKQKSKERNAANSGIGRTNGQPIEFNGKSQLLAAWSKELGIALHVLQSRLYAGWSVEKTLTTPPRRKIKRTT